MDVTLRAVTPLDHEAVHEILTSPHVVEGSMRVPYTPQQQTADRLAPRSGTYQIVAVAEGQVVGFGELVTDPDDARHRHAGDLNLVAVRAGWEGRGIGRSLTEALMRLADDWLGLSRLGLIVFDGNDRALRLYESLGFEHEGVLRRFSFGPGRWRDAYAMSRLRGD